MIRAIVVLAFSAALAGCSVVGRDFNKEPQLSAVGAGLTPQPGQFAPIPVALPVEKFGGDGRGRSDRRDASTWQDESADLFRDTRAVRPGDVVTVKISIKDKASIDNTSNRSRNSKTSFGLDSKYDMKTAPIKATGEGKVETGVDQSTTSKGEGAISRSESIDLLIAAVVTGVLPNGNLIINGSQEVRVNFEVRVLSVAGVVRPRDISNDNSISYDKIAEARISYGGRGRITEVQQPSYGQQFLDLISPF